MPPVEPAFRKAVANIAKHGDTDVFPFPSENHVFHDKPEEVLALLMEMHKDLNQALVNSPPQVEGLLSSVGYTGFRWVTQIDPIWNAYFLGLVIAAAPAIEEARLPIERQNVFSYRFSGQSGKNAIRSRDRLGSVLKNFSRASQNV